MGEVYRATDLTLGQPVALKILPEALSRDDKALARFFNEVRVARQVTHPNVCRVYDIGFAEGLHYISMEFVDGEDSRLCCGGSDVSRRTKPWKLPANFARDFRPPTSEACCIAI